MGLAQPGPRRRPQEPARPCLGLVGHTDVVPTGPEQAWSHPPFAAHTDETYLWGRGAADMKGGLAALVTACEAFLGRGGGAGGRGSLAFLVTSDEEGPAVHGIAPLAQDLAGRGLLPDWCLIGEPSSEERCADQVRIGRRGSLNARMQVRGLQGHVAYPERVRNPIHAAAPFLAELAATAWDQGTELFPPTSLQVSNFHSGTGAANVVPGEAELRFNFRFSPASSQESLRERVEAMVGRHGLDARLHWQLSAAPFYTAPTRTWCGPAWPASPKWQARPRTFPPRAAPPTAAFWPRWAPRWWSWGRATTASTRWTSGSSWPTCSGWRSAIWRSSTTCSARRG